MQEEKITFKTANLAKEKGFTNTKEVVVPERREYVDSQGEGTGEYHFVDVIKKRGITPTQSQLQKWLREKHNIDVVMIPERYSDGINYCVQALKFDLKVGNPDLNFVVAGTLSFNDNGEYPTYELALEKGLQEALKLVK